MRIHEGERLYSASDLVNFLGCAHNTALDARQLTDRIDLPPDDALTKLLQKKGLEHEQAFLQRLRAEGRSVVEVAREGSIEQQAELTAEALKTGVDVVYQGALLAHPWHGYSDFLLKAEGDSALGAYTYDVADTKLSRTAKPSHILQMCVYADLLSRVQDAPARMLHVILGDGGQATIRTASVQYYYEIAKGRFEAFAAGPEMRSTAERCGHCAYCRWKATCEEEWESTNHLCLVARISRGQIEKLRAAGIANLGDLAKAAPGFVVPSLNAETFERLHSQASLQLVRRETGEGKIECLPLVAGKGFNRLPEPNPGDLFFDMEGDPLFDGRLEYLFGFVHQEAGKECFMPFWAHDRVQEKAAFEQAVDFMVARLAAFPGAHIYHYAPYEETAIKRLAMYHGTRENEVDDFLRRGQLIDLYRVVREAIRTSERGYSLKDLEIFYMDGGRDGEVTTGGDSIVVYEQWRGVQDEALLDQIAAYNELDCRSVRLCRDWLIGQRPPGTTWREAIATPTTAPEKVQERQEADDRTQALIAALMTDVSEGDRPWRELLGHLLEFHRREAKPTWWAMFTHKEMAAQELLDDAECLALLVADPAHPPRDEKRSKVYSFTFPPQDFKMQVGDEPLRAGSGEAAGEIFFIDEETRRVELKLGPKRSLLEDGVCLIPEGPVGDKQLRAAVYRYAEAVAAGEGAHYAAITDILAIRPPRLASRCAGAKVIPEGVEVIAGTIDALRCLENSYLLVQGPPGSGKTYTSSHAIAALLCQGARIGVASNSHKAINNLLAGVQAAADEAGIAFRGVKRSSKENQYVEDCRSIENTTDNKRASDRGFQLIAGTAWLFARPEFDQALDYLFVDEAGQVSLANLVAMGVAARNIVLVGDQMQLSQPIQGDHPGGSAVSALDHLMGDHATVPPDRGIFLGVTRRMHPDLCRFISEAVYDGRLTSHDSAARLRDF